VLNLLPNFEVIVMKGFHNPSDLASLQKSIKRSSNMFALNSPATDFVG